jgi:hypothetical protein
MIPPKRTETVEKHKKEKKDSLQFQKEKLCRRNI